MKEGSWNINEQITIMRNNMSSCIKKVAKELSGECKVMDFL